MVDTVYSIPKIEDAKHSEVGKGPGVIRGRKVKSLVGERGVFLRPLGILEKSPFPSFF